MMKKLQTLLKKYLKTKSKDLLKKETIKYLNNLKDSHSKLNNVSCSELISQEYLRDQRLNPKEVKLLFKLRTRMYKCKENFKNQFT